MDEARSRSSEPPRPHDPRGAALEEIRRLDPASPLPGPWASDDELAERLLRLRPRDSEGTLRHVVTLIRPAVEREVREVLDRDAFVLDVAEVALRVFARLAGRPSTTGAGLLPFRERLQELARLVVREELFPDPLEPPALPWDSPHDPAVVRAAQGAFNRLPREERLALRLAALEGRWAAGAAAALKTDVAGARATLRAARRRFAAEHRRLLADAARRQGRDVRARAEGMR